MKARTTIIDVAQRVGFEMVHIAAVRPTPSADALDTWIARGHHAEMAWIARGREVRRDPRYRVPWARSALVLAVTHHVPRPPDPGGRTGIVARYAWGRDYHNVLGRRLRKLKRALAEMGIRSWGGVDTAPILERSWARAAGLGFTGKHTLQILPGVTSWFLLGVLFVDAELTPDRPVFQDHCKSCVRCLEVCPTNAFPGPYQLDARRCISYWTIEAAGLPPASLRRGFGRWIFGCDLCQERCPHNHHPPPCPEPAFAPRHAWLDLDTVLSTPDEALLERFTGTPLRRPGAAGLKRNALIALGNLGDDHAVDTIRRHGLTHRSEVVRGASVWALNQLGAPLPASDPSELVRDELRASGD